MIFGLLKANFQGQDEVPEKISLHPSIASYQTLSIITTLIQIPFHFVNVNVLVYMYPQVTPTNLFNFP